MKNQTKNYYTKIYNNKLQVPVMRGVGATIAELEAMLFLQYGRVNYTIEGTIVRFDILV